MDRVKLKEKSILMTEPFRNHESNFKLHKQVKNDLSGEDRLISNVLTSWAAHFVFIVAGFIMPRMIDRRLGQELLGVWDFAWSLVNYFGLVQVGVSSSVNRYVARYRAAGDASSVNRIVSSSGCILGVAGLIVIGLAVATSLILPYLFATRLGENVLDAQWVVLILGASLGIQICLTVFTGVLTGCHRWGLHNIIKSGWHAATVVGMIVALLLHGGLRALALVTFVGFVMADATRVIMAYTVCKGLQLRLSLIEWYTIKELFIFGGKTLIPRISNLLINQTTSILIVAYLGPAALALYARPRSLISHVHLLVDKMAMVLTPTVSSLQSMRNLKAIRELLIKSVRYSLYMALPMVLVLVVFGGSVLRLWMGMRYANGLIPAILAAGYLVTMAQQPVLMILVGLNAHGRAGMAQFVASVCSVGLTVLALGYFRFGLAGVATAVILPLTVANVVYLPLLVCRRVDLDLKKYFWDVTAGPAIHVLPFLICLLVAKFVFGMQSLTGMAWGMATGGTALAFQYYRHVLPNRIKVRMSRFVGLGGSVS